jgi:demethylmacrocin O-methyltransferase
MFSKYGSDKESRHNYAGTYSYLLKGIDAPHILEIGLGSVNDYPYAGLAPGGSLQAWRAGALNAVIVGGDIDPEAVNAVSELAFVVDQTSSESLTDFASQISRYGPFDLIVDDGFHDPHANLRTLLHLFPLLNSNGSYVIEDVHESLLDLWKVMALAIDAELYIVDLRLDRPGVDDNILLVFKSKSDRKTP